MAIALIRSCPITTDILKRFLEDFASQLVFRVDDKPFTVLKSSKYELEAECF